MVTLAETRLEAHLTAKGQLYKALLERSLSRKELLQARSQLQGTDLSSSPLAALVSPGASRMPTPKHPSLKLPGESKLCIFSCFLCTAYFPVSSDIIGKSPSNFSKIIFDLKKDHLKQARKQTGSIYSGKTIVTFLTG